MGVHTKAHPCGMASFRYTLRCSIVAISAVASLWIGTSLEPRQANLAISPQPVA